MPTIARQGITLVGISLANLEDDGAVQLALPFGDSGAAALDVTLDELRLRFGSDAITRAVLLHRDQGIAMPVLPDEPQEAR